MEVVNPHVESRRFALFLERVGHLFLDLFYDVLDTPWMDTAVSQQTFQRQPGDLSLWRNVLAGKGDVNLMPVLMKSVRVQGIFVGSREMFEAMNRAIALHRLRPIVDRVFGFTEVQAALRHMESGAHFGKICVRV